MHRKAEDNAEAVDIGVVMRNGAQIDRAIQDAVRDALLDHKRSGDPIVVWQDGKVVWIPADQIVVNGDHQRRS